MSDAWEHAVLPPMAQAILRNAALAARGMPADSLGRRLEIEGAVDRVRAGWSELFRRDGDEDQDRR